jgi:hypothetical protein
MIHSDHKNDRDRFRPSEREARASSRPKGGEFEISCLNLAIQRIIIVIYKILSMILFILLALAIYLFFRKSKKEIETNLPKKYRFSEEKKKECLKKGGEYMQLGLWGGWQCQIAAKDAGKQCRDGSECESGRCLTQYQNGDPIGKEGTELPFGKCDKYSHPFGCYSLMKKGKPQWALCVD